MYAHSQAGRRYETGNPQNCRGTKRRALLSLRPSGQTYHSRTDQGTCPTPSTDLDHRSQATLSPAQQHRTAQNTTATTSSPRRTASFLRSRCSIVDGTATEGPDAPLPRHESLRRSTSLCQRSCGDSTHTAIHQPTQLAVVLPSTLPRERAALHAYPAFANLPTRWPTTNAQRLRSNRSRLRTDEEEFRLFVDATAGLEPEQAFRDPGSLSRSRDNNRRSTNRPSPPQQAVSPDEQTPTTLRALQQLAGMPLASTQRSRQHLTTSVSGLDLWLQLPSRPMSAGGGSLSDDDHDDKLPPDDELPDYARSQAQA